MNPVRNLLRSKIAVALLLSSTVAMAHDELAHDEPTYSIAAPIEMDPHAPVLTLMVRDQQSNQPTAARFTLKLDGATYVPPGLDENGLRFVSIHQGKNQRFVATYTRGTGAVRIPLPRDARQGTVTVTKGYDYRVNEIAFRVADGQAGVETVLGAWHSLRSAGWLPADEHVHYERSSSKHDKDWLTILAADGLTHAHFMVLKGGNLGGIWAQQYAYGQASEATDGKRVIRAGEEFRDGRQGHINLLGINRVIEPISTGGIGSPATPYNYPPLHDVFLEARRRGGIGGPAHGAKLSRSPTAVLDTVLGAVDFFEIANTHLYKTDVWYRLMNCGFITPPAAGTDLPNFPFRESWQPLLGETRMYVRMDGERDFHSWKNALRKGEVFVTSGPMIQLDVAGAGPGQIVRLPAAGGTVTVKAQLASPRALHEFELLLHGEPLAAELTKSVDMGIHRWFLQQQVEIKESCWIAARGTGIVKQALQQKATIRQRTMAHTAVVQVLVGDQQINSQSDLQFLIQHLADQHEYYRAEAQYEDEAHRQRFLRLFDRALEKLESLRR